MKAVTPSALALECSALVRSLGRRTIAGELRELNTARSGNSYFKLYDDAGSYVSCRTRIPASEFPAIGDRVIATGSVEVFAAKSLLQLAVTEIRKDDDE